MKHCSRGSYTLEAAIVMSTIIFILFAIISAFLLLYQNAVMYYVASKAAQQGSIMWTDTGLSLDGTVSQDTNGLYYRLTELAGGGGSAEKKAVIQQWAEKELKKRMPGTMVGNGGETVTVQFQNTVFQRLLTVKIDKEVNIPFKKIAQYFSEDLDLHVSVTAAIAEPAEYIRNIDYAKELTGELWKMVKGKLGEIVKGLK